MNNLVRGVRSFLSFQRPYTFLCNIYYYVFKHNVYKHNFCDIIFTYLWQLFPSSGSPKTVIVIDELIA